MNINFRNKKTPIYNRKYQISNELADLDPIIAKILSARGVTKDANFHLFDQRVVGENHLKMQAKPIKGETQIDVIAFNQERIISRDPLELIYKLEVNEFRGKVTEQLLVENIYSN
ncbi:MAG: hypothetical protein VX469_06080 [Pseudomonadota bacterium]|nr:hypothetical protein [Pseudomonadota bacterium]